MSDNKATGTIKSISEEVQVTDSFKKRVFVLTTDDMYPQDLEIECVQDNTTILDKVKVGESVEVSINLRGREYTKKDGSGLGYFNSINAWKIDTLKAMSASPAIETVAEGDGLPF